MNCAVVWKGTGVAMFSEKRERLGGGKKYIDGVEPRSTFIRSELPPFLPDLGIGTVTVHSREEEGGD